MSNTLQHLREITCEMIMTALYAARLEAEGKMSSAIYGSLSELFNHTIERSMVIRRITNYLYLQQPCVDPLVNIYAFRLINGKSDSVTTAEQWGGLTEEMQEAEALANNMAWKFSKILVRVQGLRAATLTLLNEIEEEGTDKQRESLYALKLDISVNYPLPSLQYMKSLYESMKDYWVVQLLPDDEDHLNKSHYLNSTSGVEMLIGKYFRTQYLETPAGKVVFDEPEIVQFKR